VIFLTQSNEDKNNATGNQAQNLNTQTNYAEIEEVKKLIQSETDKVRTKYVQEKKELEEQLKQTQDELNKLKPVEKSETEKELEKRIAELEKRDQSLKEKSWNLKVLTSLTENGLKEFHPFFIAGSDEETLTKNIEGFKNLLEQEVEKQVAKRLGNSFKPENHKKTDDYQKMLNDGNVKGALGHKLSKLFS